MASRHDKRTAKVEVRLTPAEKVELAKRAGDSGVGLSDLIRAAIFDNVEVVERRLDAVATDGGKATIETVQTKEEGWRAADEQYRRLQEEKHGPLV